MNFFGFILFRVYWVCWTCRFMSFDKFGKFSAKIFGFYGLLFSLHQDFVDIMMLDFCGVHRSLGSVLVFPVCFLSVIQMEWFLLFCLLVHLFFLLSPFFYCWVHHWVFNIIMFFSPKISICLSLCLLFLCWNFLVFAEDFYFFFCFTCVHCSLKHFIMAALKNLSGISGISHLHFSISWFFFFPFHCEIFLFLCVEWFLIKTRTF